MYLGKHECLTTSMCWQELIPSITGYSLFLISLFTVGSIISTWETGIYTYIPMIGNRTGNKIICLILVPNQFHPQFHILQGRIQGGLCSL